LDQGDYREAQSLVAQSLTLFREIDDREGTAHALRDLAGIMLLFGGESQQIRCVLEESLAVAEGVGDERGIGLALLNLGRLAAIERDGRRATDLTEDSLIRFRRLADEWSTGQALWMLGWLAWLRGDREQAQRHLREHLDIAHRLEDKPGVGFGLLASAILACSAADLRGAHANLAGSIRLLQELASPTLNDAFSVAGHVAVQEGDLIRGTRLLAVGTTGRPPRGPLWSLLIASWRADWEVSIALARSALGEEPFASVWAEGQAMPLVQAISDALGEEADEAPG